MFHLRNIRKSFAVGRRGLSSTEVKPLVGVSVDNEGIATLQLQRAPVNSFSLELLQELHDSVLEVEKNKCKGLVLTSESPKIFSAGMDLKEFHKPEHQRLILFKETMFDAITKIFGTDLITTVAINGYTAAGACFVALSCDYRVMTSGGAAIGINDTAVGIPPATWIYDLMSRVIGPKHTEYALTSSAMFSPGQALQGYTAAGACIVGLTLDYRTMTSGPATIGVNDTAVGIPPAMWIYDLMSRLMGPKNTEYALTSSVMYSPEQALQVGLIDEIAADKSDAVEKCKAFIRTYDQISPAIRATTKRAIRQECLTKMDKNRNRIITDYLNLVESPGFQEIIDQYIQNMKHRKAAKTK